MADNIRQFRTREAKAAAEREQNKKIQRHRLKNHAAMMGFLLAAVVLTAYFYIDYQGKKYDTYSILEWNELDGMGNSESVVFGENLLRYNKDGAAYIDFDNKQLWNQPYEMQAPIIDTKDKTIAIADKGGNKIYIFNEEGLLGEIETLLPIQKIAVSDVSTVAVLLKDSDVSRVHYYNISGELISEMKIGMDNMGYPLAMDLSPQGKLFMLSFLSVSGGKLQSVIAYYNFGNVGQEYKDRLVKSKTYENTIFPVVEFLDENISAAYGDNRIQLFEGDQIPEEKESLNFEQEIQSVFSDGTQIGVVLSDVDGEASYAVKVYNLNGKEKFSEQISFGYEKVKLEHDKLILFNDHAFEIYSMNGVRKFSGEYESTIKDVISTNKQSRYIVITPTELDRIKLE